MDMSWTRFGFIGHCSEKQLVNCLQNYIDNWHESGFKKLEKRMERKRVSVSSNYKVRAPRSI